MGAGGEPDSTPWARAWEQIDADFDGHLDTIRRFLQCPTVSASDNDMLAGAEFVAAMIEAAGGTAEIVPTDGHPAVLGRIEGDGPTLLRYGMYDVQPTDEPGWTSPPFAAITANVPGAGPGIVARGAANSKGSLASFLLALASARRVSDLPADIVFLVDGEEELGSPNLPFVMSERRADLAAEAAFDMDLTAIALEPRVLVGDEPVSMLDASVRGEILKLLVELKDEIGMTLVLITHDLGFAWAIADRVAIMYLGKIVEVGPVQEVLTDPLHPYTKSLLAVTPEVGRRRTHEVLSGEPPDPAHIPTGCRFHPRCPMLRSGEAGADEPRCLGEVPKLQELAPDHRVACHVAAERARK